MKLPAFERNPAAPDLAARRPARAARRTGSSTGSPPPGSRGGRCCRSGRRTRSARRTSRASAFAGWAGLLAEPDAPVSPDELEDFVARQAYWIADWAAFAGGDAIADQVRFEREWNALRAYAHERGVRLIGDLPIYVAPGSADHRSHPELFQERRSRASRRTRSPTRASSGATRSTTGPRFGPSGYRWWIERFRRTFELVDLTRVDHFRGFVAYWAVPGRGGDGEGRRVAAGAGPRALRRGARGRSATCRSSPRTSA